MANKKRSETKVKGALGLLLVLTMALSLVSAVGVATSYWDDNPLKLAPGESTTVSLRLQSDSTNETLLNVTIDSSIAKLMDGSQYTVASGVKNVPVNIRVEIPKDAPVGTKYNVVVSFQEVSSGEGGMLRVAQGITSKLPVLVVGQEESSLAGQKQSGMSTLWRGRLASISGLAKITAFRMEGHR